MTREIKFRGYWNKWDSMYYFEIYNVPLLPKEAVLMQFTGLLDKNGKEIYEGDIILVNFGGDNEKYPVEYFGKHNYPAFDLKGIDWLECNSLSAGVADAEKFEVIGNIYENPELLTTT